MTSFNPPLLLGFDQGMLQRGMRRGLYADFARTPHLCATGATGTGKSVFVKTLIGRIALHFENAKVTICDFKNDDYKELQGCARYHYFTGHEAGCEVGLDNFYREYRARQSGEDSSRDFRLLVFEEWASYLNTISDRKIMESEKLKLTTLLMLSRNTNAHVLISQQRMDSSYLAAGGRDQLGLIIALGNISREAAMMYGFNRDTMLPANGVGAGHILVNGSEQIPFQASIIKDFDKLDRCIRKLVSD